MLRALGLILASLLPTCPSVRAGEPPPLGCQDIGVFPDLDPQVRIALPAPLDRASLRGLLDERRALLLLYAGDHPVKAYPLGGPLRVRLGASSGPEVGLREADAPEVVSALAGRPVRSLVPGEEPPPGDRDGDGLPDPLDILVGAKKVVANGAAYTEGYVSIGYPGGDVPREMGVCTDTIIRAMRNAGLDLQVLVHEDIRRAPKAYPMVKGRGNPSIDHRRVRTILPWFVRHFEAHGTDPRSKTDPFLPGDVVFLDTLAKAGPDHVGVVSDLRGESGLALVVNNWTVGYRDAEMDLLAWVPVTHRFRAPPPAPPRAPPARPAGGDRRRDR